MYMLKGQNAETRLPILFLFGINLLAGLLFINEGIFHYDSVILAQAVEKTYQTGVLQPAVAGRYGSVIIACIVYLPFYLLGQNADLAIRLSSLLSHAFSIVALYFLVIEFFDDRRQAFIGALLLSFMPAYFSPNTYGKEHGMSMLFLILSFYYLHRGLRKGVAWQVSASGLLYAFAVSVRESILVLSPLLPLLYFLPEISLSPLKISLPRQRLEPRMLLAWILPLALCMGFMFLLYLGRIFSIMVFPVHTASVNFLGLLSPMFFDVTLKYLAISVPGLFFFFSAVGVLRLPMVGQTAQLIFFLGWACSVFYFGNTTSCPVRYLDHFVAPLCVVAAAGFCWMYKYFRTAVTAMVALIVFGMWLFMYPILEFRHHYNGTKRFAIFVGSVTEENAVVLTADDFPFIEYYGRRKTMFLPLDGRTGMEEFLRRVNGYLDRGVPVYLTEADYRYQYPYFQVLLDRGLRFEPAGEHLTENYHNPDLMLTFRDQKLYRVSRTLPEQL